MALPNILRRLFKGGGYGPELNDGIVSKTISNQDWSNAYSYPVGVVVRGSDGALYYSVEQSGPGTSAGAKDPAQGGNPDFWKKFGSGDSIPTGTVLWLSTPTVPIGFLLCNGSAVGRETYPDLFTAIGTTYGVGDGSTTFNLPNLIDKFAQGSAVAGTVKAAGLPNITGTKTFRDASLHGAYSGVFSFTLDYSPTDSFPRYAYNGSGNAYQTLIFNANNSNPIYGNSDTVQPPALTLLPCIKAFSSVVGDATVVAGQLVNDIQSKVALDGSNLSGAAVKAVVETWHSGTEWYRVWSDGWCEQGGSKTGTNVTVNLYKAYINTNYTILTSAGDANAWDGIFASCISDKATSSFKFWQQYGDSGADTNIVGYWMATGYIS